MTVFQNLTVGLALVSATIVGAGAPASAQVADIPPEVSLQGHIITADGLPLDSAIQVVVAFYTDLGDTEPAFSETVPAATVASGRFALTVGTSGVAASGYDSLYEVFADNARVWVGLAIDGGAELPRQRFSPTAYALRSRSAASAEALDCEECIDSTHLAAGAVTASSLSAGAVTWDKLNVGAVTAPAIGPSSVGVTAIAAGAVTAEKIGVVCAAGQVLKHDGMVWACGLDETGPEAFQLPPATVTELGGVYADECPTGQVVTGIGTGASVTCGDPVADASLPASKLAPCEDGQVLRQNAGTWTCDDVAVLLPPSDNLVRNPSLADTDNSASPDLTVIDAPASNVEYAPLTEDEVHDIRGGTGAIPVVGLHRVDLRSTVGDGTSSEAMTIQLALDGSVDVDSEVTCSVWVRRPDVVGTTARARLQCMGAFVDKVITTGDTDWYRLSVTTRVASEGAALMRVFGSGFATSADTAYVRYAMPKAEFGAATTTFTARRSGLPKGMIAFFMGPCPTGFEEVAELQGRVIMGTPGGGQDGATQGAALADQGTRTITEVPEHSHSVDPPTTATSNGGAHTHTVNPAAFNTASGGNHNHSFTYGAANIFGIAGGSNASLLTGTGLTETTNSGGAHTHSIDVPTTTSSSAGDHTHDVDVPSFPSATVGSPTVDVTMPYMQLRACRVR